MSSRLDGKVAIVTGSSSGLGEATAVLFAKLGASVTLCGRNQTRLEAVRQRCVEACDKKSGQFLTVLGDLGEQDVRIRTVDETVDKFGRLDIVVANAGVSELYGQFETVTEESYDRVHQTNLKSVLFLLQRAAPHLVTAKGSIVTLSSVGSTVVWPIIFSYSLTKAALDHMVRMLSVELGAKGVRVNNVRPGLIPTRIDRDLPIPFEDMKTDFEAAIPCHRMGLPSEVAKTVAFLVSDDAGYINGADITVDAGLRYTHPLNMSSLDVQ